ncbi:MAG: hypothetical protein O6834_06560 [Actinobacteria bacterium]|nr:hypothetical protein [Actinomycetota bacterium]
MPVVSIRSSTPSLQSERPGSPGKMRFYHNDSDRIRVRDQVALAIATALAKAGISMPTPELVIHKSRITDAS